MRCITPASGNLDRRGIGDIDTLTVREYLALPAGAGCGYRLYRHPLVMFGIGPVYLFLLQHRLPIGLMRGGWRPGSARWRPIRHRARCRAADLAGRLGPFLLVHLPITLLGGSIGVWLFYVQHQFEQTYWDAMTNWEFHEAALHGSSHYDLPRGAALVHRQYRHPPRPPPVQPHPVLPAAAGAARSPGTCRRRPSHAVGKPEMSAHGALERRAAAGHLVSRIAGHGSDGKCVASTGTSVFILRRVEEPVAGRR